MPERIQRRRTKGWRMPDNAAYVGRPTKWGNPYTWTDGRAPDGIVYDPRAGRAVGHILRTREDAIAAYRIWLTEPGPSGFSREQEARVELAGRDLACWCPPDQPCHADVLLEIANPEETA